MREYLLDDARCEYFAGGDIYPKVEELKKDGRWNNLDKKTQEWYLTAEHCKEANPKIAEAMNAYAVKFAARFGLALS